MFASHKKNTSKKTFQKPNILRKKSKVAVMPILATRIEPDKTVLSSDAQTDDSEEISNKILIGCKEEQPRNGMCYLPIENKNCATRVEKTTQECDFAKTTNCDVQAGEESESDDQSCNQYELNIESFINGGALNQNISQTDGSTTSSYTRQQANPKWCLNLLASDVIIDGYNGEQLCETEQHVIIDVGPCSMAPAALITNQSQLEVPVTATQTKAVDCFTNRAVKFKCDEPDCNKGFWSEERLNKHKNSHKRQARFRTPVPPTRIECPVKKVNADGIEEKCERFFDVRPDLLKHLNTDHTLEDASYGCSVCGRRFFWAAGLRAHAASACARGGLACAWPGCARVFRLPCRLREHARAHSGDRPYLCHFPECGWAFRSASKLVRHARRHTGERRHACAACGRAFLRREHLRDHCRRHHAPHAPHAPRAPHAPHAPHAPLAPRAPRPHACPSHGCEQSFTNMSSLYMHMKKVHRKQEEENVAAVVADVTSAAGDADENVYLVSLVPATEAEESEDFAVASVVESAGEAEGFLDGCERGSGEEHAARTHCTWPLQRDAHTAALLEDDAQAGAAAGYSVRSDLFLHANTPLDEDSTNIGGAGPAGAAPLDAGLCLIDPHPTIDLMQEELMYDDAAVDETSFRRVFLLNGDELT